MIMDIQIGQSLMPIYIVDKGDAATVDGGLVCIRPRRLHQSMSRDSNDSATDIALKTISAALRLRELCTKICWIP